MAQNTTMMDNILYEMFIYAEWKPDPEVVKSDTGRLEALLKNPPLHWFRCFQVQQTLSEILSSNIAQKQHWQIALGDNGKVVAVLGDTILEVRTKRGDYSSIVSRAKVPKDPYPQWRKMVWSPDCSMLAIVSSNGTVGFYDLTCANLFDIDADCSQPAESKCSDRTHAVSSIVFVPVRVRDNKWSNEVLIIDYRGALRSFSVSTDGFKLNHKFTFNGGVAFATYNKTHNVLYVTGLPIPGEKNPKNAGFYGLEAWRLVIDAPFYKLSVASNKPEVVPITGYLWSYLPWWNYSQRNIIFEFAISPEGNSMICIHTNGDVSLWHLPALKLIRIWPLNVQPQADMMSPLNSTKTIIDDMDFVGAKVAWWNNEAIILARNNGAVSICETDNLRNLLGDNPEFLQGCPQIMDAFDNTFLALECESKPMTVNEFRQNSSDDSFADLPNTDLQTTDLNSSEMQTLSLMDRSIDVLKTVVYFITDIEQFQPKPKKIKVISKIYRLLGLKSTTPNELYLRKIDAQSYDEALVLAEKYDLDFDLVYQQKWRKSKVSIESIKNSLMRVTKKSWIVHQCCDRLPESLTAAKELLNYGLKVTEREILKDLKGLTDPKRDLNDLKLDDLTLYSTELLRCRHLMLFYIDRLNIYETITKFEGASYWSEEYNRLRNGTILKCAIDYSREGRIIPLMCLWPLLSHQGMKLTVLNNLPETISPHEYRALISDNLPSDYLRNELSRKKDWCEKSDFSSIWSTTWSSDSSPEFENENILSASVDVRGWFINRATEIGNLTGLTNNALTLIKIGKEIDVPDLNEIYNNLLVLDILIYDLGIMSISLKTLQESSHLQICHYLMSKTTKETFVSDIKRYIIPYSQRQEKFVNLPLIEFNLLNDYLINLSKEDLTFPAMALQHRFEIGLDVREVISIAEQCLSNNTRVDQLSLCYSIFYAIPRESDETLTPGNLLKASDEIEKLLSACTILESHGIKVTFSELKEVCSDVKQVHLMLKQMTQNINNLPKTPSNKYSWDGLLSDILELRSKVFQSAEPEICYEIYASALLSSGDSASIKMAAGVLTCAEHNKSTFESSDSRHCKVPLARSIELVLKVAKDYFNSASSLNDDSLELARICLSLIECNDKDIREELDLLSSLKILDDFGLQMLPIQVRLCNDKMSLIEECLNSYKYAYQSDQKLLQIARYLRIAGNDERTREALILECVGTQAISDKSDSLGLAAAASAAARLAGGRHARGWKLAWQVASEVPHIDRHLRLSLLAFALLHCPPQYIQDMLRTRLNLESELLQEQLGQTMEIHNLHSENNIVESQDSLDSNEEEFNDALTSPSTEELPPINIQRIDKHLRNISSSLYNSRWKKPLSIFSHSTTNHQPDKQHAFDESQIVCQEFYRQIYPNSNVSDLTTQYDTFALPELSNKHLNLYTSLLRIKTIEDCLQMGRNIVQLNEVLLQSAQCATPDDTTLSLALLLTVKENNIEDWPKLAQCIYIKMYCIMLKSALKTRNECFLDSPKKLLFMAISNSNNKIDENILKCFEDLKENSQNEKLKKLNPNVNLMLFSMDTDYRNSCILGLARTTNENNLQLALELADKYGISKFELCFTYAEYLITNYETIGYDVCLSQLCSSTILPVLKENATELMQRFNSETWNKLNGTNPTELILFYTLIERINGNITMFGLTVNEHIKLLKKVKSTSCNINYQILLRKPSPNDLINHIVPLLKIDNVGMVMKLLRSLSTSLNFKLDLSNLYRHWLVKSFFNIPEHIDSSKKWMQQFRECCSYFNKMTKIDIVAFIKEICFGSIGTKRVAVATRSIIVKQTLDYFHFENLELNAPHSKAISTTDSEETKKDLIKMATYLDGLSSAPIKTMFSRRPDLQPEWTQLGSSYGDNEVTFLTLSNLILDYEFSIDDIRSITNELGLEIEMDDFVRYLLKRFLDDRDTLKILIKKITHNADHVGISKHVLNKLKVFASGTFQPSEEWIKIIFMHKDSDFSDENNSHLLNQYTKEMIKTQWTDDSINDIDFRIEENRLNLVLRLLSESLVANKLKVLVDLMNYWPKFTLPSSEKDNPYLLLIQRLLDNNDDDNGSHLKLLLENHHLSPNAIKWAIENTPNAAVKQLLYLILLSKDKTLFDLIPYYLSKSKILDGSCDENLSELIVKEKLTVKFINTPFYPSLVKYLMSRLTSDSPAISDTIDELRKLGYLAEASALQMTFEGIPAALKMFNSIFSRKK